MTRQSITEATTGTPATLVKGKGKRYRVRLIEGPRWGSSGYYTTEALDSAPSLFEGRKAYLDHPTATETTDRPERSLRDLVGHYENVAREPDGVWGELVPRPHMAELVASLASNNDLDVSIRAMAEAAPGEVDGRSGLIIRRLTDARSVDLVTEAGAGGRVYELIESARQEPDHEVVERLARDRRDQVQRAVQDAWADRDRDVYVWLADFDDTTCVAYFEAGGKTWAQTYVVAPDDMSVTLTGERAEVRPVTTYHPIVTPAGGNTTTQEAEMPQIEEARLAELTESANRVPALETERDTAIARAEAAEALVAKAARDAYTATVTATVEAANLPAPAAKRVTEALELAEGAEVPDNATAVVAAAVEAEQAYIRSLTPTRKGLGFNADTTADRQVAESYTNPWGRTITTKEA